MRWRGGWRSRRACSASTSRPATAARRATGSCATCRTTSHEALADFVVAEEGIALTVVGPEAPLASGIVDVFRARGLRVFGPTRAAAQLESSKDFAKAFMQRHGIPTAAVPHVHRRRRGARLRAGSAARRSSSRPTAWRPARASSLRQTVGEAEAAIESMLVGNTLGASGARVVIEDFLEGEEASFIVMSDGRNALALATSQDHKRLLDGDHGPNTGGMGAYSPAPIVTPTHPCPRDARDHPADDPRHGRRRHSVHRFPVRGPDDRSRTATRSTLEFNCRMGDPETQPIMARLKSDFVALLEAAIDGRLDEVEAEWDRRTALGVVVAAAWLSRCAAQGRCDHPACRADRDDCITFHAGTALAATGSSPTAAACSASRRSATRCVRRRSSPTMRSSRWSSTACSSDGTSATGR